MFPCTRSGIAPIAALLSAASLGLADTTTIHFEDYAVGTIITTQFPGVTFSAPPDSCGGAPPVRPIIVTPNGGTSSPTRGLSVQTGCPDFSPDFLRVVFDQPQGEVTFTVGDSPGTYQVRAYNVPAGGAPVSTQNIVISGSTWTGVFRFVRIVRSQGDIRRIEIEDTVDDFEVIDDLTFACPDGTSPIAEISVPAYESCDCDNSVGVRGRACELDGDYDYDTLHYMPIGGTTWMFIDDAFSPQCVPNGALYTWDTAAIPDGGYFLLLTVYNECGLSSEAVTVVYIHRDLADPVIRVPNAGLIVGGTVCIDGSAYDSIGCFDYYRVDWKPVVGGAYAPVDLDNPQYPAAVINDPLASWDTRVAPFPADGGYRIRVESVGDCGSLNDAFVDIVLDNTAPLATITQPGPCGYVDGVLQILGTADDTHLGGWIVEYTGGDGAAAHTWQPVPGASGNAPVVGGVLGQWDTTGLTPCAYTLRLRVFDTALVNCDVPHVTEYSVSVNVGARGDINCDGVLDFGDINPFVQCLTGGCAPCP